MLRRLFISIFKVAAGLACFVAPWVVGNWLLIRASLYKPNLDQLNSVLPSDLSGTDVAIGDCTIFPLKDVALDGLHSSLRVMGFGGSQIKEWYYLVKNNFENLKKARLVVIGTNPPHRFQALASPYTSFLPYLMTWTDLYQYAFVEQRIDDEEALRFAVGKVFNSFLASQSMRFLYYASVFPNYRSWHELRSGMIRDDLWRARQRAGEADRANNEKDLDEYFRKIADLSAKMDHRLVYLLTPRSSWTDDAKYKMDLKTWTENCERFHVRCFSMGRTMPDRAFGQKGIGDGIHMNHPDDMAIFWNKLLAEWDRAQGSGMVGVITPPPSQARGVAPASDAGAK